MTAPGLPELRDRLSGGIMPSVVRSRSPDHGGQDDAALARWPGETFLAVPRIHDEKWSIGDEPRQTVARLTTAMAASAELLDAVVLAPEKVLDRLLPALADEESGLVDAWIALCWTSEAAWSAVSGDGMPAEDSERLRPLAARLRFLVLSEPMRWRARPGAWWDYESDRNFGGSSVFGRVLGESSSWERLVDLCVQARAVWQECLDRYQDHPLLRQADPSGMEQELRQVLFRDGCRRPLALSAAPLSGPARLTLADQDMIAGSVERHLLPRFAIGTVTRLGLHDDSRARRLARAGFAIAVVALGAAAVGMAAGLEIHLAVYAAAACYVLICAGIWALPAGWGAMWLLRMPAASAVGVITLVTFMPGGWVEPPPRGSNGAGGWHASAVLAAAALGYLLIQARNHGLGAGTALRRTLVVIVIGLAHALMISVLGLTVIAPAFVQSGWDLHELWARPQYGHAGMVLVLATAWCLAFGVFSQILWDDRPITAALAHLNWRK